MSSEQTGQVPSLEEVIKITDPGEINREEHGPIDRLVIFIGNIFAWLFPILMVAIVFQVIVRKMGHNQAWLDDAQWWMYGSAMLAGLAYAVTTNSHVRVDIFHAKFSREKQARIELFGLGWLFLPFLILMTDVLTHYAWSSIVSREGSDSPTGLHRLYLLKSLLPILFLLTILATLSAMKRYLARLGHSSLAAMIIAGLPSFLFAAQLLAHYALWWYVRLTQPDIKPSRINREPIMDNALWLAVGIIAILIALSLLANRLRSKKGS